MKITFIFPPQVNPSCIPIGMAALKAYIKKHLPKTDVSLIDLNLSFVNRTLDGQLNNLQYLCQGCNFDCSRKESRCPFQDNITKELRQIFKKAKIIIKDKRLFFDKEIFNKYVGDCHNYIYAINGCIERILKEYIEGRLYNEKIITELLDDEIEKILAEKPNFICFSILVKTQVTYALALAKVIKQKLKIPIIFGGPALFNFDSTGFMNAFDFVDIMVLKEGEESIVSLLSDTHNKNYDKIPNLVWRNGFKTIINEIKYIEDLDSLPTPDFEGLKLNEYFYPEIILPIATSRGCPWSRCKFCQLNIQYSGPYRERSIEKVIADIKYLKNKYNAANFFFTDSEISAKRLKMIAEAVVSSKLKIYFACYARPTKNLNLEVLKIAYKAGARFFQLGVESLADPLLRFVNKGTSVESIKEVFRNTDKLKIKNLVYMLACVPTQTRKELLADFRRISFMQKKYNIFSVVYCLYSMAVHQDLYAELKNQGVAIGRYKSDFNTIYGRRVYSTDMLQFSYKSAGAYDILTDPREGIRSISYKDGLDRLMRLRDKFQLNSKQGDFILNINNFLFETQLLYAKEHNESRVSLPARKRLLKFYLQAMTELKFNSYKKQKMRNQQ